MKTFILYYIFGKSNIQAWDNNEIQDIDINQVYCKRFDTSEEKKHFINALYQQDKDNRRDNGNYLIIDEDEYNFLIN